MEDLEYYHFVCECSDSEHDLRFVFDPEDGTIYTKVYLRVWRPLHQRLWIALRYILKLQTQSRYGAYDCTILRQKDYAKLRALLDRSDAAIDKKREEIENERRHRQCDPKGS